MTEAPSSEFMTITVLRCWGVAPAAGGASFVLETREWGKSHSRSTPMLLQNFSEP